VSELARNIDVQRARHAEDTGILKSTVHLRANLYRSSKHMVIFGIWQFQARNYSFVAGHQTVRNGSIDEAASASLSFFISSNEIFRRFPTF
jgi:hypothetical protein